MCASVYLGNIIHTVTAEMLSFDWTKYMERNMCNANHSPSSIGELLHKLPERSEMKSIDSAKAAELIEEVNKIPSKFYTIEKNGIYILN